MRRYSLKLRQEMSDQQLGGDLDKNAGNGRSITVERSWEREDEDAWPSVALWIKEQFRRLRTILEDSASGAA